MAIAILLDEISNKGSKDVQHPLVFLWTLKCDRSSSRCPVAGDWNRLDRHSLSGLLQEFQRRRHSLKTSKD